MPQSQNNTPSKAPLTWEHPQGKALIIGAVAIFALILLLIVQSCNGISCMNNDVSSVTSATDVSATDTDTLSQSDIASKTDLEYGIIPTDGSYPLEDVQILNVYHSASQVKNGNAVDNLDGTSTVYFNGKEVTGTEIPERYEYEDTTVVWTKKIWIADDISSASFNIIPDSESADCKISVTFPDGTIKTSADNIFSYPSSGTYRWTVNDPDSGIYSITLTGTNIEYYYLDFIAYSR